MGLVGGLCRWVISFSLSGLLFTLNNGDEGVFLSFFVLLF